MHGSSYIGWNSLEGATMATIKLKGPGGGRVRAKRVSRTWMITTIKAQQKQLDTFSQQVATLQASVNDLQAQIVPKDVVSSIKEGFAKLRPGELAPLAYPAQVTEPQVTTM